MLLRNRETGVEVSACVLARVYASAAEKNPAPLAAVTFAMTERARRGPSAVTPRSGEGEKPPYHILMWHSKRKYVKVPSVSSLKIAEKDDLKFGP
jgi:hypothetical protein